MKYLLPLLLFFYFPVLAQKGKIRLEKGQKIALVTTLTSEMDMGMGIQVKNNLSMNNEIGVTGENGNEYQLISLLNRVKGNMEVMGQLQEFDSDNAQDSSSEIAKALGRSVRKAYPFCINKFTGAVITSTSKDSLNANHMNDLMSMTGNSGESAMAESAFFKVPEGKKAGESWSEQDSSQGSKVVKTYTLEKVNYNEATISFTTVSEIHTTIEAQENELEMNMNTNSKGEIITDILTAMVSKKTTDSTITGTMGVMGQTMNISGTNHIQTEAKLVK